jgi:hypothetical protein
LKRVRQQEDAVDRRAALKIGEPDRGQFINEPGRPITKHLGDRHLVGYRECEVHVGEAITAVHRERTHYRPGYDAVIRLPEPQDALAESIPLLDGKHAYFPRFLLVMAEGKASQPLQAADGRY